MGNRIDVLAFLAQVVEENTTGYRSDFQYDVRMLTQAAQEKDMRDRVFYWMSRPSGTWCVKEREVFLQGSGAHSIWTYYADQPEGIRAYRVTITGMEGRKVMGQVIPLDYKTQVRRVQEQAIPATALTLQYESGHIVTVLDYNTSAQDVEQFAAGTPGDAVAHIRRIAKHYRTHTTIGSTFEFIENLRKTGEQHGCERRNR